MEKLLVQLLRQPQGSQLSSGLNYREGSHPTNSSCTLKSDCPALAGMAQLVRTSAPTPKGWGLDSLSGHMPGPQL